MASSLLSLALDHPLSATVAMTGELTLTGKVLRIGNHPVTKLHSILTMPGGLREKVVAAKRSGITQVIFPKGNTADWEELPENIKQDIEGIPVEWYSDVFAILFKDLDQERAKHLWKSDIQKARHMDREISTPPREEAALA